MKRRVAIIGTGMVKTGTSREPSALLFADAALEAIREAGMEPADMEALHLGNTYSGFTEQQTNLSPLALSLLGIENHIPCTRYEAACCSASVAFRQGYLGILSGEYEVVLVGGTERLKAISGGAVQQAMATSMDSTEREAGLTFGVYWAYVARAYARKFDLSERKLEEMLAEISVKNHYHGSFNALAQFRNQISVDDVMSSAVVSPPVKLLDCAPFSDGAAALVLASEQVAGKAGHPVWIAGSGHASGRFRVAETPDLASNPAIAKAAGDAFRAAGMTPGEVDVAEVHDCVNIHEVICLEDAGLFKPGEGIRAAAERRTYASGDLPVNLSGGLKTRGHPVGATGAYQLCEVTRQLRGDFGGLRPERAPNVGMTINVGGTGTIVTAHLLANG
jgi:acetyl-CoA acetyltransferase